MTDETGSEGIEEEWIDDRAERVESKEEFLAIIEDLIREVRNDPEVRDRDMETFLDVVHGKLKFSGEFPGHEPVELPDQPSWNWLARVFVMGAFEN